MLLAPILLVFVSCGNDIKDDGSIVEPARPVGNALSKKTSRSTIQVGETLDVFVMEDETFNGKYEVRSRGDIIVPKLGRVRVGGLTAQGAEGALKRSLEKGQQLTGATVIIERANITSPNDEAASENTVEAFLSGKVMRPGRYDVVGVGDSPPTIHQAVLQAGGCTRFAHKKKAHILRKTTDGRLTRVETNLLAIERGEIPDVLLASGDIIVVPEKKVDLGL